jgi:hypothetical protein
MFAHSGGADSEDRADFSVCFSSGEPAEHLALTQSQQAIAMIMSADWRLFYRKAFPHRRNPSLCDTASDSRSSKKIQKSDAAVW